MDNKTVNDVKVMQIFVDALVGIPKFSYPGKRNVPRPKGEFCSVHLIEQYPIGLPITKKLNDYYHEDDLNKETVIGSDYEELAAVKLRYRLVLYRSDGEAAIKISNGWFREEITQLMISTGYGFSKCRTISLEDALLEKSWEKRVGFSVELYTTRRIVKRTGNIDRVTPITGLYEEGLNSTLLKIEINK